MMSKANGRVVQLGFDWQVKPETKDLYTERLNQSLGDIFDSWPGSYNFMGVFKTNMVRKKLSMVNK